MDMTKALHLYPLVRIVLMLILGIVIGDAVGQGVSVWLWPGATVALLSAALVVGHRRGAVQGLCIMAGVMCMGAVLVVWQNAQTGIGLSPWPQNYRAIVMSEPQDYGKTLGCDLLVVQTDSAPLSRPFKVKARMLKAPEGMGRAELHVGDGVEACSALELPEATNEEANFNYSRWLRTRGYVAQTFVRYHHWRRAAVRTAGLSYLQRAELRAMKLRRRLLQGYRSSGIGAEEYSVLAAMTLGDKTALSRELQTLYSVSGASHVLALSGLHLSMIYAVLTLLMGGWLRRPWLAQAVILSAMWAYVVLVGMPVSALRAAVMLSIYSLCVVLQRQRASVNTLAFAAVVLLVANPLCLWDVGFQMSFMAVLAILVYYPVFYRALHLQNVVARWLWGLMVVSFSAQIGTAPLVMYYFGRFSAYSLLANMIVVPAATLILYAAVLMFLCMPVAAVQGTIIRAMGRLVAWVNAGLAHIVRLPGANIEDIHISPLQLYLVYMLIVCLTVFGSYAVRIRRQRRLDAFVEY